MGFMERLGTHSIDFSYELSAPIEKALLVPACGNDKVLVRLFAALAPIKKGAAYHTSEAALMTSSMAACSCGLLSMKRALFNSKLQVQADTAPGS